MGQLNYKHLRYFWAVARIGNLTRAAERLNVSQSALSTQIRTLEERLGQDLFERHGRALRLTEAGRIALDHADTIFKAGEEMLATLGGAPDARPTLRVGALATLSRNFQIGLLQPLLDRGDTHLMLRSGAPEDLLRELERMTLDLLLMNRPAGRDQAPSLRSHRLFEQQVSLVATPARLDGKRSVAEIMRDGPFILPSPDSSIRIGFDALAQRLDVRPTIIAEADDMAMMRLLARQGVGVAPLPPVVVRDELAEGELIEACKLTGVVESFYAITAERRFPNPALAALLDRVLDHADPTGGAPRG
ncbi:MAG: LysR family transcriptional regulator [Alphaproteobacteria bacterium]|nr:LysR family transcriptional regulator [Alphaproteobacteria bacterium]